MNKKAELKKWCTFRVFEGETIENVAKSEGVNSSTIVRWLGEEKDDLNLNKISLGSTNKTFRSQQLAAAKIKRLYEIFCSRTPDELGFKEKLWSRNLAYQLIKNDFKQDYSRTLTYTLLTDLGFNFQNHLETLFRSKSPAVKKFLETQWLKYEKLSQKNGSTLLFVDEFNLTDCFHIIAESSQRALIMSKLGGRTQNNILYSLDPKKGGVHFKGTNQLNGPSPIEEFIDLLSSELQHPLLLFVPPKSRFASSEIRYLVKAKYGDVKTVTLPHTNT